MMLNCKLIATTTAFVLIAAPLASAADPDWESMDYTMHKNYQAEDGSSSTFLPSPPIKMKGIILNNPEDMLDSTPSDSGMGGQWQIFFQTVDSEDCGGTACWMGQNYGVMPWLPPSECYSDSEWLAELDRLNFDPQTGHEFRQGDLIEVRGRVPGLYHKGKANINEGHNTDPANDFDVILLEADYGVPEPTIVPDLTTANIFDSSRTTGGEYYQGTWVRIEDVSIVSGTWGAGNTMTIDDGTDTFPMLLSVMGDFDEFDSPTGTFDVLGIFDQEENYRLWVLKYEDIIQPPSIVTAESVKFHGDTPFGIDMLAEGATEPRFEGPDQIVLTFDRSIEAADGYLDAGDEISITNGTIDTVDITDNVLTVETSGFDDDVCLEITIAGLIPAGEPDFVMTAETISIPLITGDGYEDGGVTSTDIAYVKYYSGSLVNADNFRYDVYADGGITSTDIAYVKFNSGNSATCP